MRSGPVTFRTCGRRRAQLEAAQRVAVRVALPDRVEEADGQVDRLAGEDLARDVDERAVAQVDGVVEPEDQRAQCPARATRTRRRARGRGRTARIRRPAPAGPLQSAPGRRPARADRRCRSRTPPCATSLKCSATRAGTTVLVVQVMSVRSSVPNLRPARNSTLGKRGSAGDRRRVEQVAGERRNAVGLEALARRRATRSATPRARGCRCRRVRPPGARGARATVPSCRRRRGSGCRGSRRATRGDVFVRRLGEQVLELGLGARSFWQRHRLRSSAIQNDMRRLRLASWQLETAQ